MRETIRIELFQFSLQQQSQWTSVPPPPIINLPSEQTLTENDEEKQKREGNARRKISGSIDLVLYSSFWKFLCGLKM